MGPESRRHYLPLDSMRGLAAIAVVLHHFTGANTFRVMFPHLGPLDNALFRNSQLCVDLFFVLSGIVIAMTYLGRDTGGFSFRDFMVKRIARVYPLHVVVLFAFLAFRLLRMALTVGGLIPPSVETSDGNNLYTFVLNLLLLHGLGFADHLSWNGPSWSISAEFFTYAIFGGVMLAAPRLQRRTFVIVASLAIALLSLATIVFGLGMPDMDFNYHFGILRCTYGFFVGVLAYFAFVHLRAGRVSSNGGGLLQWIAFAASIGIIAVNDLAPDSAGLAALVFAGLFVALMMYPDGSLARILSARVFVWLGHRSYSIYMTHVLVIMISEYALRIIGASRIAQLDAILPAGPATLWALAILGTVFVISDITYRFVEKPGAQFVRSLLDRRKETVLASP